MSKTKKIMFSTLMIILALVGGGIHYVETRYEGIGLPWTKTISLPAFPEYPDPKTSLSEGDRGVIHYASKSPYDFSELLTNYDAALPTTGIGTLTLPEGASADSPVPAIIILHGSGGIAEGREHSYAKFFNDNGIAAFVLDYYQPRGVTPETPYLKKMMASTETDIITDAYNALKLLGTHPAIDANRVGVTGYSYGGMATRYTMDPRVKNIIAPDVPPFALHMDIYGPCHQRLGHDQTTGGAYLSIFGDADNSIDPESCKHVYAALEKGGSTVENHIIKGAGHAWENQTPRKEYPNPYVGGCTFKFHPETGRRMVSGQPARAAKNGATRGEPALVRTAITVEAPDCIKEGYIIGKDDKSNAEARGLMLDFLERQGFVAGE